MTQKFQICSIINSNFNRISAFSNKSVRILILFKVTTKLEYKQGNKNRTLVLSNNTDF